MHINKYFHGSERFGEHRFMFVYTYICIHIYIPKHVNNNVHISMYICDITLAAFKSTALANIYV
jgi:hypothetical protein